MAGDVSHQQEATEIVCISHHITIMSEINLDVSKAPRIYRLGLAMVTQFVIFLIT